MRGSRPGLAAALALASLLLLAAACAIPLEPSASEARAGSGALQQLDGCAEVEVAIRQRLFEQVDARLMANLEQVSDWLASEAYCCSEIGLQDATCDPYVVDLSYPYGYEGGGAECAGGMCGTPDASGGGASAYSTTNNQVAGVHEADFIKNDGRYIYLLSGAELVIFAAWPAAQAHELSRLSLAGEPRSLLLDGDRAVVFSSLGGTCAVSQHGEELLISVLDLSDRSAPRRERELWVNGRLLQARRVERAVHAVIAFPQVGEPELRSWPEGLPPSLYCGEAHDAQAVIDAFLRQRQLNWQRVMALDVAAQLPRGRDLDLDAYGQVRRDADLFSDCQGFHASSGDAGMAVLSVLSLPSDDDRRVAASFVLSDPGVVYASAESLYVAITHRADDPAAGGVSSAERTSLHRFALDNVTARTLYQASGEVAGRPLNQFSMDEHEGRLRIATTEGYLPDPATTNNIFILQQVGGSPGQLRAVGALTGIAPTEDIRSARFDGARGFLVTFKKTDPLFVFDLSDPASPRVEGELHIPGFSTYMHFLDPDHLLSIGFDAEDEGSFAWFTGVMLQLFDVGDPTRPQLLHREVIGTRGTTSDATGDHLAFNYFAALGLLAVPMGICEDSSGDGSYGTVMTFNGLLLYRVDVERGFTLLGGVDHLEADATDGASCYYWWTSPDSQVKRSVFMEDFVYSVSRAQMKVNALADLDADLAAFDLPQLNEDGATCW